MKSFLRAALLPLAAFALLLSACNGNKNEEGQGKIEWKDIEKDMQTQFIMVEDGNTIELPEGYYKFTGSLSMDGKHNIIIKGAGIDKTVFSFAGQTEGAEGVRINECSNITLQDLTLQDSKGDLIKTQKVHGITFKNVKAEWTGEPKEENGSYAFYPVDCDSVLLDNCISIGASDAGIYVGQSRGVIVKNCEAYHNVAGIEIENCIHADVFDNYAHENTGGLLVFDMPNLTQNGSTVRLYKNRSEENNYKNFAPKGNIVGEVPPGTGVMVMATKNVEIFDNDIENNKTMGIAIVSYKLVKKPYDDPKFNPYPKGVYVYDNRISHRMGPPALDYDLGKLLLAKFPLNRPDIIIDGFFDPDVPMENGNYTAPWQFCIGDNNGAKFANIDAPDDFSNISEDRTPFDCQRDKIAPVQL